MSAPNATLELDFIRLFFADSTLKRGLKEQSGLFCKLPWKIREHTWGEGIKEPVNLTGRNKHNYPRQSNSSCSIQNGISITARPEQLGNEQCPQHSQPQELFLQLQIYHLGRREGFPVPVTDLFFDSPVPSQALKHQQRGLCLCALGFLTWRAGRQKSFPAGPSQG